MASSEMRTLISSISDPELKKQFQAMWEAEQSASEKELDEFALQLRATIVQEGVSQDIPFLIDFQEGLSRMAQAFHDKQGRRIVVNRDKIDNPNLKSKIAYEFARLVCWKNYGMTSTERRSDPRILSLASLLRSRLKVIPATDKGPLISDYREYAYSCDCRTKWITPKLHGEIKIGEARMHCEKCKSNFAWTGESRAFTPKVLVKRRHDKLVAIDNFTREILEFGYISVSKFISDLSKKGYKEIATI